MKPLSEWARWGAIGFGLALAAGLMAWAGVIAGLLLSLPMLALMPGLLRQRLYAARVGSLLLVFYVALLLAEGYAIRSRHWVALGLAALAALQFACLNLYVRWWQREHAGPPARTAVSDGAAR